MDRETRNRSERPDYPEHLNKLEGLGREAGAVLAVLVLARLWPKRFSDGWVTDLDFGNCSRDLPKPRTVRGTWRDTLKREIRLGIGELKSILTAGALSRQSVSKVVELIDPRERATRLVSLPSPEVEAWFARVGVDLLDRDVREEFRAQSFGVLGTLSDYMNTVDEGVLHLLLELDTWDSCAAAVGLARQALARAETEYERRLFAFGLARAEVRSRGNHDRGRERLRELAATPGPFPSPADRRLQARILIALAHELSYQSFSEPREKLAEPWALLDRARSLLTINDNLERGDMLLVQAHLEHIEAIWLEDYEGFDWDWAPPGAANALQLKSELAILSAVRNWHPLQQWGRIRAALMYLRRTRGAIRLGSVPSGSGALLIPWLRSLVRYEQAIAQTRIEGERSPTYTVHDIYCEILTVFNGMPADMERDALPLPAEECVELVNEAIEVIGRGGGRTPAWATLFSPDLTEDIARKFGVPRRKKQPVELSSWFVQVQKEKGRGSEEETRP